MEGNKQRCKDFETEGALKEVGVLIVDEKDKMIAEWDVRISML